MSRRKGNDPRKTNTISFEQESISGEEIARRAYQLFEERGAAPGYDLDDWYRAEQDLREEHRRANGNGNS
jgi:hypothetical protein